MRAVLVVAVTGGMGAGKSTAARWLGAKGAVVLGLDEMAKSLLEAPEVRDELADAFGTAVLGADGGVDRAALAAAAFSDDAATRRLDAVVHPHVVSAVRERLAALDASPQPPAVAVLDVPLLVESPELQALADLTLLVTASEDTRVRRLAARGISGEEARRRIARQSSEEERRAIADAVVENEGGLDAFHARLASFWEREVVPRVEG